MHGKVAVVTGASSGIGRATAALFARSGMNVVAVGRNEKELSDLTPSVADSNGSIKIHLADVTDVARLDEIVADAIDSFGRIDVLVNSAGIIQSGSIETTTEDDWARMIDRKSTRLNSSHVS